MTDPPKPIKMHNYVLLHSYWAGRADRLEGKARADNPYSDPVDRLAWLTGWDDETEYLESFKYFE